jgi:hypothetical protein
VTVDRYVLAGALVVAAISIDAWSVPRAVACLAVVIGVVAVHERLRREFATAVAALTSIVLLGGTSLYWSLSRGEVADALAFAATAGGMLWVARDHSLPARWMTSLAVVALAVAIRLVAARDLPAAVPMTLTDTLFSSSSGWLSLTPIAYAASVGLLLYLKREASLALISIVMVIASLLVTQVAPAASGHQPFGHGMSMALAVIAPGLAALIEYARVRPLMAALPLVAAAGLWNYWLMVQYTVGTLPKDEPVSFAAMVRQQADVHTRPPYVYPFALPANVLFAWREDVPADRFEVLSREPHRTEFDLVMDRAADRFLLDGWGGPASTPMGAVRWTAARRATLVAPLVPSASGDVITLTLAARSEQPAVAVDLSLELNGVEVQRVTLGPNPVEQAFEVPPERVGAVLRAGYNRLTLVNHGIRRLDAADLRPLGPLAARSATVAYPVALHRIRITPAS